MSLNWLFRLSHRTHTTMPAVVLALVMTLIFSALVMFTEGGLVRAATTTPQFFGTIALFILLPSFLLAMMAHIWRGTQRTLSQLQPVIDPQDEQTSQLITHIHVMLDRMSPGACIFVLAMIAYGIYQSSAETMGHLFAHGAIHPMDAGYVFGNVVVWLLAAGLVSWRLPVSLAFLKLGRLLKVNLYQIELTQPITRMATTDLLTAAGGMAFMALQSLDAAFRIANYTAGLAIGLPAGLLLIGLPLWGLHQKIIELKAQRLGELHEQLGRLAADPNHNVAELEALSAHIARVKSMPSWPVNLNLVTRIFAVGVIPPVAWIGAALVENIVDKW